MEKGQVRTWTEMKTATANLGLLCSSKGHVTTVDRRATRHTAQRRTEEPIAPLYNQ